MNKIKIDAYKSINVLLKNEISNNKNTEKRQEKRNFDEILNKEIEKIKK